ncbi:MAG TPA: electron transport complex subunit RsxC [Tissierellales bacterium]|nr:electron transport complex subunit RsxC [Tissierellales bacterium]
MKLENLTFKGGTKVPGFKEFTENLPIEKARAPEKVIIPLQQHIGAPCDPVVKVGDKVKVGQVIGQAEAFVSAPVHASISGTVKEIGSHVSPTGMTVNSITIEADGKNEVDPSLKPHDSLNELTKDEILSIIKDAGITGMGGASFPTYVKLSPPKDKKIDTIIINGSECEPYLTSDYRLMVENPEAIVFGLKVIMKAVGVGKGFIGIEDNKPEAIKKLREVCKNEKDIKVVSLKAKYPQGDEKRVINAITNREVPSGGLPMDVGAIVSNAGTANAIGEAVRKGKPLYERIVTVTGKGIKEPKNLIVKIGTSFRDIIEECGGYAKAPGKIIMGGPMMGISQYTDEVPVIKGTSGILVLTQEDANPEPEQPCIKCGKCLEVCPVNLQPLYINKFTLKGRFDKAEEYHALDCIECGACSYICPSKRTLVESIRLAKGEIIAKRKKS